MTSQLMPETEAGLAGELQTVVFRLDTELYGAEISTVREINTLQKITPVPRSPRDVRGIMNLRGRVITVIDLRTRLGLPSSDDTRDTRIMVVEADGAMVGCLVDAVQEVLTVSTDAIEPAEAVTGLAAAYLNGIVRQGENLIALIDLRQVLADYLQAAG